jgi:hypothetical protein
MKYSVRLFPSFLFLLSSFFLSPKPALAAYGAGDTLKSTLPLIKINSNGQTIPDEPKIKVDLGIIDHGKGQISTPFDEPNDYHGMAGFELRGSSSQMFPKKAFGFETWRVYGVDTSVSILGMPAESDWVLHAPYSDKSLIRNALTYYLFERFGHYSPRNHFCEVFVNEEYMGLFLMVEKIKRDKNRVDIAKLTENDTSGLPLTGGYILKIDKSTGSGSTDGFASKYWPAVGSELPYFMFEYPDGRKILPLQQDYIENKVDGFEAALYGSNFKDQVTGYRAWIDVPSFVDYFIINEISKNVDGFRLSTFLYKNRDDRDPKFYAGPVWDYDLAFGNANYSNAEEIPGWQYQTDGGAWPVPFWWDRLQMDKYYLGALRCRWEELRRGVLQNDSILETISRMVDEIGPAADRNFKKYPILGTYVWPNPYIGYTYQSEIFYLKNWVLDRLKWLDTYIPGTCLASGIEDAGEPTVFRAVLYPNPSHEFAHIEIQNAEARTLRLIVYEMTGRVVFNKELGSDRQITEAVSLPPGIYQLMITDEKEYITLKAIVN